MGFLQKLGTAGASLIGAGLSAVTNGAVTIGTNQAQKKLAMDMYNLQRKDALADWNMQNEYNAPQAQMARFKAAGLNPNLIYGQQTSTPSVRTSNIETPSLRAVPVPNIGDAIGQYQQIKQQQAQTDLTQQATQVAIQREQLLALNAVTETIKQNKDLFSLEQQKRMAGPLYDQLLAGIENLQVRNAQGWQALEERTRGQEDRLTLLKQQIKTNDLSIQEVTQRIAFNADMNPKRLREMEARINQLFATTRGQELKNTFDQMTMQDRSNALIYAADILSTKRGTAQYESAQKQLQNLLLQNNVNMMGVNNILQTLNGVSNLLPTKIHTQSKGPAGTITTKTLRYK